MLSAEEYRAVFEASPDGIMVVDQEGVIHDLNPQVEALFGFAREELVGEAVEMLMPDAFRSAHREHRKRFMRNPQARPMGAGLELQARRRDGSAFPVEISLSPWTKEHDRRVVCSIRDVTERKRLQDFSEGALRSVEEERQRIARELHDDTAQRLATLMLRVRLLGMESDEDRRRFALEELREQILEAAEGVKRIARGLRPPELEEVGLVSAFHAHLRNLRESTGVEVEAHLDAVDHLLSDEAKLALYRIVQESLSNAVRHSGAAHVCLTLRVENAVVSAEVEDDGRGFRADRVAGQGGGLGLVGMQERAFMIGARVTVDSTPGEGTRVRVELPSSAVEARNA